MSNAEQLRGLLRDTRALHQNVEAAEGSGSMVFGNAKSAEDQIRRILGRTWALRDETNWACVNDHARQILGFACHRLAVLGSCCPDDWDEYKEHLQLLAEAITEWTEKRLSEHESNA